MVISKFWFLAKSAVPEQQIEFWKGVYTHPPLIGASFSPNQNLQTPTPKFRKKNRLGTAWAQTQGLFKAQALPLSGQDFPIQLPNSKFSFFLDSCPSLIPVHTIFFLFSTKPFYDPLKMFLYSREEKCHFLGRLLKNTTPTGLLRKSYPQGIQNHWEKMSTDTF